MQSAQIKTQNAASDQNKANHQFGAAKRKNKRTQKRYKKNKKGGRVGDQPEPDEIVVPQPQQLAKPAGPTTANSNTVQGTETLTTGDAESEFDSKVGQNAGSRKRRKTKKKSLKRKSKKSKKSKKTKKNKKSKKTKKSKKYRKGGMTDRQHEEELQQRRRDRNMGLNIQEQDRKRREQKKQGVDMFKKALANMSLVNKQRHSIATEKMKTKNTSSNETTRNSI